MDNYLQKNRFNRYYFTLAQRETSILRSYARQVSSYHLKNLVSHLNFNNEIDKFITQQLQNIKEAKDERECKKCIFHLKEEKRFIYQQDMSLRPGSAKVIATAELVNKLDGWGYVINGVGVVLSGFQVVAGLGLIVGSAIHGNVVAIGAGILLVLHGVNGLYEGANNFYRGENRSVGMMKDKYIRTAEFMGFDGKTGIMAYASVDIALSGYGLARMALKPDVWRLFRNIPSDYVRNIRNMSKPLLIIEGIGDSLSIKSTYENYHN